MKLYSTVEIANITGLTRSHLAERCKKYKMPMTYGKYRFTIFQWNNLLTEKHREKLFKRLDNIQPIEFIPTFDGVIRITEEYRIYDSKSNFWHNKTIDKLLNNHYLYCF